MQNYVLTYFCSIYLLDWILEHGYAKIIAGAFCAVLAANNLALIPFMLYGKRIRKFYHNTWLSRMHKRTVKSVEVA